ncbi:PstS family phosphate ABC transporter substrate-binding protein [Candidatus Methanoperedens nitratireducens]|uniref:Putative Phosphate-binding protein PstS n=1 Tax=Candidatus Methanoperedens nitratireducens TaxID=1392998 RepID=A0A284VQP5_9EURY|nr:PstS family phosphate ABC transporter substrate-binding protein [Candidatus Methanoperedens nitroreducens]SNQ61606.1 putative Phosphate-binding protein PstS [Candidatus Methanoperedens nitroreducens]
MKKRLLILPLLVITVLLAGCIGDGTKNMEQQTELKGVLKLDGSTTVYPIAKTAAEEFMKLHPAVTIDVQQSSTGEGLVKFLAGETDISDATRAPKDNEYAEAQRKGMKLHMTVISNDAVGIIVHTSNPVSDLTTAQLKAIYFDGTITDWSQLTNGTKKGKINIYNTDPKISGTAELFNTKIAGSADKPYVAGTTIIHPTPKMIPTIKDDPDGLAYTPVNWINNEVKMVKVNGVAPTQKTILDTSYLLSRKMYMITDGAPKGLNREFISYILSGDGQSIVQKEGFIPVT